MFISLVFLCFTSSVKFQTTLREPNFPEIWLRCSGLFSPRSTTHLSRYVQDCMGLRSKPRQLYSAVLFIGMRSNIKNTHNSQAVTRRSAWRTFIYWLSSQTNMRIFHFPGTYSLPFNIEKDVVLLKMLSIHVSIHQNW